MKGCTHCKYTKCPWTLSFRKVNWIVCEFHLISERWVCKVQPRYWVLAAFQTYKRVGSWLSWIVGKEHRDSWDAKSQGSLPCKARVRDWNGKDRITSTYLA